MTTSTPLNPRSLAHRLTTVGHSLHHRLFAQLRDSDIHPKTALILGAIDGRVDAPWIRERLTRGGKRISALADRGWIERIDDGWTLTASGREILDRVDAERSTLLSTVPAEELSRLAAALDVVAEALGIDDSDGDPRGRGFRPGMRGFGPGMHGFGPGMRRSFGPDARGHHGHGHQHGDDGSSHGSHSEHDRDHHRHHGEHDRGHHPHGERAGRGCDPRRGGHGRGHHAAQRAYERGFDAGFSRGREASASRDSSASGEPHSSGEPTASE